MVGGGHCDEGAAVDVDDYCAEVGLERGGEFWRDGRGFLGFGLFFGGGVRWVGFLGGLGGVGVLGEVGDFLL